MTGGAQEYKFVEVRLSSLCDVQLVVISRLKHDQLTVSRRSVRAQSTVDQRVSVTFDQQSFPTKKPITFTAQVISSISYRIIELNCITLPFVVFYRLNSQLSYTYYL